MTDPKPSVYSYPGGQKKALAFLVSLFPEVTVRKQESCIHSYSLVCDRYTQVAGTTRRRHPYIDKHLKKDKPYSPVEMSVEKLNSSNLAVL